MKADLVVATIIAVWVDPSTIHGGDVSQGDGLQVHTTFVQGLQLELVSRVMVSEGAHKKDVIIPLQLQGCILVDQPNFELLQGSPQVRHPSGSHSVTHTGDWDISDGAILTQFEAKRFEVLALHVSRQGGERSSRGPKQ